jgi:hypothetical protein
MDTPKARAALAEVLQRGADRPGWVAAAKSAVIGLSRCPIAPMALAITDQEGEALRSIEEGARDDSLRRAAMRVRLAWKEDWQRDRLLMKI